MYAKLDNTKVEKFLKTHKLPKLTQEERENFNSAITKIDSVIKNFSANILDQIVSWVSPTKHLKKNYWASLMAQWLRICLPMQGTRVPALVWEDPTCHGPTGPVSHNYWACASGACAPQQEARTPRWRVAPTRHN